MAERRTPGRRPGDNRRPSSAARPRPRGAGERSAADRNVAARTTSSTVAGTEAVPTGRGARRFGSGLKSQGPRLRLTGRSAILLLVVVALAVSFASSMRAYLEQRDHINALNAEISQTESDIDKLEKEKARWDDPAYVERQARLRFGYVMPGEKAYTVLDADGNPLDADDQLSDPGDLPQQKPQAWWDSAWTSLQDAGHPKRTAKREPADLIKAPRE